MTIMVKKLELYTVLNKSYTQTIITMLSSNKFRHVQIKIKTN